MKRFVIPIFKTSSREIIIEAEDHETALQLVLHDYPGWHGDVVVELLKDDEIGEEYSCFGTCENCGKMLWDEKEFVMSDDGYFCLGCVDALKEA
jgi:hypothetical protein